MSRYIEVDLIMGKIAKLIEHIKDKKAKEVLFQVGDAIMDCPTEDVVPRSEVEEIIVNIADLIWQGEDEKLNIPMGGRYFSKQEFIAELKKKYGAKDTNVLTNKGE